MPQGSLVVSTSNENSLPVSSIFSYLCSVPSSKYTRGVTTWPATICCMRRALPSADVVTPYLL